MRPSIVFAALAATASAGPCDIYAAAGTPCVAGHSMVRAVYDAFTGPLYQVQRKVRALCCNARA